ncbi:MAG: DUF169 domain-containing protein [Candidatus Methanomethylophilaceae archaeon]|jgi:uncharacterized protein (DUF169 family)
MSYEEMSDVLREGLGLRHHPVAVSLLRDLAAAPSAYRKPPEPIRHCQAVMRSGNGEMIFLPSDFHACKVGASVLGMNALPDRAESGDLHSSMGLFRSPEAARDALALRPMLAPNSVTGTLYSPLSSAQVEPDVVLVALMPEQAQWLLPTSIGFDDGSRLSMSMSTILAACGDATVMPYITGKPNASFGCFGFRKSTDITPEEMLVGIPFGKLETITDTIRTLAAGTIPKSRTR